MEATECVQFPRCYAIDGQSSSIMMDNGEDETKHLNARVDESTAAIITLLTAAPLPMRCN